MVIQPIPGVGQAAKDASDGKKPAGAEQQITPPIVPGAAQGVADGGQPHTTVEHPESNKKNRKRCKWAGPFIDRLSTVVIALFTAALVWVGYLQRSDLVEVNKAADVTTKAILKVNTDTAKAEEATAASNKLISDATTATAATNAETTKKLAEIVTSMEKAVQLTEAANKTAQQSADASTASATNSAIAINDSRINVERQMRAFLSVNEARLTSNKVTRQIVATVSFHNSGVTPAKNVAIQWVLVCLTPVQEFELSAQQPQAQVQVQVQPLQVIPQGGIRLAPKVPDLSIGPGVSVQEKKVLSLSPDEWNAWNRKADDASHCFVGGRMDYLDEFGHLHYTKFRFRETLDLETGNPSLVLTEDGNPSD